MPRHSIETLVVRASGVVRPQLLMSYMAMLQTGTEPAMLLIQETGLKVTPQAGRYLWVLSSSMGRFVPAEALIVLCHPDHEELEERYLVGSAIKRLRRIIKGTGLEIENRTRIGYKLTNTGSFRFPWPILPAAA